MIKTFNKIYVTFYVKDPLLMLRLLTCAAEDIYDTIWDSLGRTPKVNWSSIKKWRGSEVKVYYEVRPIRCQQAVNIKKETEIEFYD